MSGQHELIDWRATPLRISLTAGVEPCWSQFRTSQNFFPASMSIPRWQRRHRQLADRGAHISHPLLQVPATVAAGQPILWRHRHVFVGVSSGWLRSTWLCRDSSARSPRPFFPPLAHAVAAVEHQLTLELTRRPTGFGALWHLSQQWATRTGRDFSPRKIAPPAGSTAGASMTAEASQ